MKKVTKAQSRAIWLYQVSTETGEKVDVPEGVLSTSFEFPEGAYDIHHDIKAAGNGLWMLVSWLEEVEGSQVDLTPVLQSDDPPQIPLPIPADAS